MVPQALTEQQMTHREFAAAMHTKFCGSTMWKRSPSRGRLHPAAAILGGRGLHDLTTNDVFWDKIVDVKYRRTRGLRGGRRGHTERLWRKGSRC